MAALRRDFVDVYPTEIIKNTNIHFDLESLEITCLELSRSRKSLGLHEGSLSLAAPGGVQAGEILRALHISHIIKITTVHPWPNPSDRSTPDSSVVSCFYYSACLNKV